MSRASFVVPLADLEQGPQRVRFTLPEAWLARELEAAGASPLEDGSLSLELTKHGGEVMVRGHADFKVTLPCVVTLEPVPFELRSEIFLLLRQAKGPVPARKGEKPGARSPGETRAEPRRRRGRGQGPDVELSGEEAARDTFEGEEIALDPFIREFLLLELPLYPRRPDLPSGEERIVSRPLAGPAGDERTIDPRLEPLAKLAERLRGAANKE